MTTLKTLAGHVARLALVGVAAVAAAASAGSQNNQPAAAQYNTTPPPPQSMEPSMAMGLWKSSFGAVKVEPDTRAQGAIQGVWVYDRNGQEVIGYFAGNLRGNVLDFTWQEPAADGTQLIGAGYVVFDPYGQKFAGRWWTQNRDRQGEWTGWRPEPVAPPIDGGSYGGGTYGGDGYGGDDYQPPPQ